MVKGFIKGVLGIDDLEQRVDDLGQRVSAVERQMKDGFRQAEEKLSEFGNFKKQNEETLDRMRGEIENLLGAVQGLIALAQSQADINRVKRLLKRLRLNKALILKALKAQQGG